MSQSESSNVTSTGAEVSGAHIRGGTRAVAKAIAVAQKPSKGKGRRKKGRRDRDSKTPVTSDDGGSDENTATTSAEQAPIRRQIPGPPPQPVPPRREARRV